MSQSIGIVMISVFFVGLFFVLAKADGIKASLKILLMATAASAWFMIAAKLISE
jgi:hypothetical protein